MPYSPYQPYGDDELNTLQGLIATPDASSVPPAGYPNPTPPLGMGGEPPMPAPPVAAPAPVPAPPPVPAAPPVAPLDLSLPQAPTPPKGLVRSEVGYTGVPDAERDKLMGLHQQLMDQQLGATDRAVNTEADIAQRNIATGDKQIGDANVKKNTAEMALAGQASAKAKLQAEGDEWSKMKADPSKAFEGMEWAGVLAAIGIGAGTFAQAMGTQRGNPVQEAFDTHIERSIAAQKEQKNSRLNQIAARVGDIKDAEGILRAQLHDAIADRLTAEQQRSKDQDAMQRLGGLADQQRIAAQKDLVGAYEGMVPREEQRYAPPKPAAAGKTEAEKLQEALALDKALEERGYTPEQRQAAMTALGHPVAGGKTAPALANEEQAAKADKPTDDQNKALGAYRAIQSLGDTAGIKRAADGSFEVEDSLGSRLNLPELGESISGAFGGAKPIANARKVAIEGLGRLESGGAIQRDEADNFAEMLGHASSRRQIADVLNRIQIVVEPRLKPKDLDREREAIKPPSREQAGFKPSAP